ncbi:MAG TPA: CheR family methyltransferase [Nodosilinea sp.]|nr:CheR family methyltransferase [Nodosilinea sp.]
MDEQLLRRIGGLIAHHSGIHIREQDYPSLAEKVGRRAQRLGLSSVGQYYDRLQQELELAPARAAGSPSEWQELYSVLTVNESYFFRDTNQFRLLSERLLPELLTRKLAQAQAQAKNTAGAAAAKPRLRIWSAGCSTGEEIYSLAIALEEMNFPWDQWDALLMGTDISRAAIDSARHGVYGSWSFRQVPTDIQQKYFRSHHQLYQLCDRIRQRVTFQCGNLLTDPCPNPSIGLYDLDLILCRNVFIYLDSRSIGQIIQKFHAALGPQGYLLTGHTELHSQDTSRFQVLSFPESVVYGKQPGPKAQPLLPSATQHRPRPAQRAQPTPLGKGPGRASASASGDLNAALEQAAALLKQEAYASAIQRAEALYRTHPHCDDARKIAAHAYANTGRYDQAKQLCQQVLRRQALDLDMHYLLAQIAEDQNDWAAAKQQLRKIIYLDAGFVWAYLDLASIYARERQPEKSQKMRSQALSLLAKLPPETVLDGHGNATVAQWQDHLAKQAATARGDRPAP